MGKMSRLIFFLTLFHLIWLGHSLFEPDWISVSYLVQKVDPFDLNNPDVFHQRIISSNRFWCDHCPIFFYAGNEGDIWSFVNNTGFLWENAPKFNAKVIFAEHRYYGKSLPFGDHAFDNSTTLKYLTIERTLFDFAQVIFHFKKNDVKAKNSPVIVFGGSYGGMLAAWFRMKYPHLVEGALAASAPILQLPSLYPCRKYYKIIANDFKGYSNSCFESIKRSWSVFEKMANSDYGYKWLTETFKLCKPLTKENFKSFTDWVLSNYDALAMTDYPNPASFLAPLPSYPIKVACSFLKNADEDDFTLLTNIFKANSVFTNYTGKNKCNDLNNTFGSLGPMTAFNFQSCTEMILPVCCQGAQDDMFPKMPWDFEKYSNECFSQFGVKPDKDKLLLLFGGDKISSASNIIFSNGERDPWSAGGVLKSPNPSIVTITIPGACHHEDLRETSSNDPISLLDARKKERNVIKKWIKDYYNKIGFWPKTMINNFV